MTVVRAKGRMPALNRGNLENVADLQAFNRKAVYMMGYTFTFAVGNGNSFNPVLGGSVRRLHGIVIMVPTANVDDATIISLSVNNEKIISDCNIRAFNPVVNIYKTNQFFEIPRALSGSDNITITATAVSSNAFYPIFYVSQG